MKQFINYSILFLVFLFPSLSFSQKDTLWLGKKYLYINLITEKEKAKYYRLPKKENESGYTVEGYYKTKEKYFLTNFNKIDSTYKTTYYNTDGSISFKELYKNKEYQLQYPNGVISLSLPRDFKNFMNFKEFILQGLQAQDISKYDKYKIILNYSNGQNALTIDVFNKVYVTFYPNGNKASELIAKEDGYLYKSFYFNGNKHKELELDFKLNENGIYKSFYFNGKILEIGTYFNNELHRTYDEVRSVKVGKWIKYYPSGNIFSEKNLKMNSFESTGIISSGWISMDSSVSSEDSKTEKEKIEEKLWVKIHSIDGKHIGTFENQNDTIYKIFNKQLKKYTLAVILKKEKKLITDKEFEKMVTKTNGIYYLKDKPFNGKVLSDLSMYRVPFYEIHSFDNGKMIANQNIKFNSQKKGLSSEISDLKKRGYYTTMMYETGDIIYAKCVYTEQTKSSRFFSKKQKDKDYLSYLQIDIVPNIINYIINKEEVFFDYRIDTYENYFIPSMTIAEYKRGNYHTTGMIDISLEYLKLLKEYEHN